MKHVGATIVLPIKPRDYVYMAKRDLNAIVQCEVDGVHVDWKAHDNKMSIKYDISPFGDGTFTITDDVAENIIFTTVEDARRAFGPCVPDYIGWWKPQYTPSDSNREIK